MKKIIVVGVLAVVAVAIFVFVKKNKFLTEKRRSKDLYEIGAVAFEAAPLEKLDVAAKYMQSEITHAELVTRSPVLKDLLNTKLKILTEGISKLPEIKQPPVIEVYMEDPGAKKTKFPFMFSSQRPNNGIVKIGDKLYDRPDLPMNQVQYSQIETQIFEEKLRVVGDLYTKQLLLKIAKDNNTTIQGYINKSILGLPLKDITDLEVKIFAEDKGIEISENDSALKERLRVILQERKTEQSIEEHLRVKFPDEVGKIYFYPPSYVIPLGDSVAIFSEGPKAKSKESPVPTVMVFSNLKCSGCGRLPETLDGVREKYRNQVRFGFVNFFYGDDWQEHLAAQASMCLNSQSNAAFWDFFSKLSKSKSEISEALIMDTVKSSKANQEEFKKCFLAQTYKEEVGKQLKYAAGLGVTTSPTVIYGSQVLTGSNIDKLLENAIEFGLAH